MLPIGGRRLFFLLGGLLFCLDLSKSSFLVGRLPLLVGLLLPIGGRPPCLLAQLLFCLALCVEGI